MGGLVRSPYGAASAPTLQLGVTCGASIEDKDAKGSAKGVWVDGGEQIDGWGGQAVGGGTDGTLARGGSPVSETTMT